VILWPILVSCAWKATVAVTLCFAATWWMGRASAAARHFIWALCLLGLLFLPVLGFVLPRIGAPQPELPAVVVEVITVTPDSIGQSVPWPEWIAFAWFAGIGVMGVRLVAARFSAVRLARGATAWAASGFSDVRVRLASHVAVPVSVGIWRPVIVLPEEALTWSPDRVRAVLLHESAHGERRDGLTHFLAQIAVCVYWFHPLVWLAERKMAGERERACDDRVLASDIAACDYAEQLVSIAREAPRSLWRPASLAMVKTSELEYRVRAILALGIRRGALKPLAVFALVLLAGGMILPLAATRTDRSGNQRGVGMKNQILALAAWAAGAASGADIIGRVYDPSGAVLPDAEVLVINWDTGAKFSARSGSDGSYRVPGLAAGKYDVHYLAKGFTAVQRQSVAVAEGGEVNLQVVLRLGEVRERLQVTGQGQPRPDAAMAPSRIRVGGNVQAARLIHQIRPAYPSQARSQGRQGNVLLQAVISKEGDVLSASALEGADPEFTNAALEAVKQWRYQPTLLNGQPVEIITMIEVNFTLSPQ